MADKAINSQTISKLDYERYSQSTNNHLGLQNYVQNEKKVAIYAGCKMKTANELHLSNSAILHHPNNLHCTDHHFMSEGEVLTNVIKIR